METTLITDERDERAKAPDSCLGASDQSTKNHNDGSVVLCQVCRYVCMYICIQAYVRRTM